MPMTASQIRRLTAAATLANPHIWLDPRLARHAVTNILKALQQADPAHASGYATNATRYLGRLEQLDLELEQALAPLRGAAMVTYHDAFAYFARHYGLKVVGVIEPVPDIEPSLKHLAFVYRAARANQVQAIFTEPPTPSRLARQIGSDLHLPLAEDWNPLGPPVEGPLDALWFAHQIVRHSAYHLGQVSYQAQFSPGPDE